MNIEEKVKIFELSCQRMLKKDFSTLSKQIDTEIEQQIKDELKDYEEKEITAYQKKSEKLEKEYNKQIYALEMETKKEILEYKKMIQKDLKKDVVKILEDFTKTPDYYTFLLNRITQVLEKIKDKTHSILGIVNSDNERFGNEIREKYQINIQIIDDKFIGGCILEDRIEGISIDHTLKNSLNEKLENELE